MSLTLKLFAQLYATPLLPKITSIWEVLILVLLVIIAFYFFHACSDVETGLNLHSKGSNGNCINPEPTNTIGSNGGNTPSNNGGNTPSNNGGSSASNGHNPSTGTEEEDKNIASNPSSPVVDPNSPLFYRGCDCCEGKLCDCTVANVICQDGSTGGQYSDLSWCCGCENDHNNFTCDSCGCSFCNNCKP